MANWGIMTSKSRLTHPSRKYFYNLLERKLGKTTFSLADIGIISLVDYHNLRKNCPQLSFSYTGFDIHEDIVKRSQKYLSKEDRALVWDIHNPHPDCIVENEFDVVFVKHMLNYCKNLEVLMNLATVVKPHGLIVIVNNKNVFTETPVTRELPEVRYAKGKYQTTFLKEAYIKYLHAHFDEVVHKKFKQNIKYKAYSIDIMRVR